MIIDFISAFSVRPLFCFLLSQTITVFSRNIRDPYIHI